LEFRLQLPLFGSEDWCQYFSELFDHLALRRFEVLSRCRLFSSCRTTCDWWIDCCVWHRYRVRARPPRPGNWPFTIPIEFRAGQLARVSAIAVLYKSASRGRRRPPPYPVVQSRLPSRPGEQVGRSSEPQGTGGRSTALTRLQIAKSVGQTSRGDRCPGDLLAHPASMRRGLDPSCASRTRCGCAMTLQP